MYKLLYTIIVSIFISISSFSQEPTITIHKDSTHFSNIISLLEKESGYYFFYNPQWVDSMSLSYNVDNKTLNQALDELCELADLSFTILNNKKVVFTKGYRVKTNYAKTYISYLNSKVLVVKDTIEYAPPKNIEKETHTINLEYQLFKIGNSSINPRGLTATLRGTVKDIETGEPLIGAVIYVDKLKNGVATNTYGFYSFTLPKGQYKIECRSIGMRTTYRNIIIHSDGQLDVEMINKPRSLKEVVVTAKSDDPVRNFNMGVEKITMKTLKQLPMGFGEPDVIKSALLLPGVQTVGEASSGFNVRGGSTDQNLILLNDASIMNTSHFFGFFSGFNSDIIKDITLYKSGVPAKYGGRVSSVMDITLKEGDRKNVNVKGGISPVFGRLTVEAPLKKDKSSFILGMRTTYSDWVLKLLDDNKLKNSKANFYDVQGSFSYDINHNNSLYLSGYMSHDFFDYYTEDAFEYNTLASTATWKHIFNPKLFSTFSGIVSKYDYSLASRQDSASLHSVKYNLNQYTFKADFSYHSKYNHKINFGLNSIWYNLSPGKREPLGDQSLITPKELEQEQALESALYVSDEFDLTHFMSISAGLRYSFYSNFGPKTQFNYLPGQPKDMETVTGTTYYDSGEPVTSYSGPEFRLSTNIHLNNNSSVKIGISRMYQYIQMISNTAAMSPTDIWKLSDNYLKPQHGDQYSIGFYKNLRRNTIEASIETYYKKLYNILDYKGGAELIMNEHLETEVLNGDGKAYGVELMIKKKRGKLSGWVNYTYSRILHKIDGEFDEERVNNGQYFPANYDKPHDFKFVANYKFSRRLNLSTNFFYSTGRPFTTPIAYYQFENSYRVYYSDRNAMRMPDYIRLDLAATINGNLVKKKMNHGSLTFAVYNVLGRKNAYSIFFRTEGEKVQGYQMSIFAQPIFTITYNFKIRGSAKDDF